MGPGARNKFGAPMFEPNLRSFESKCTVLKKVLGTLLIFFGVPSDSAPRALCTLCPFVTPHLDMCLVIFHQRCVWKAFSYLSTRHTLNVSNNTLWLWTGVLLSFQGCGHRHTAFENDSFLFGTGPGMFYPFRENQFFWKRRKWTNQSSVATVWLIA